MASHRERPVGVVRSSGGRASSKADAAPGNTSAVDASVEMVGRVFFTVGVEFRCRTETWGFSRRRRRVGGSGGVCGGGGGILGHVLRVH